MTLQDLLTFLKDGGIIAILLLFIVGGVKRWWVWGWQYDEMRQDRNEWKAAALHGTSLADRAVRLADRPREVV